MCWTEPQPPKRPQADATVGRTGTPAEINVFPEGNPSLPGGRPSGGRASILLLLPKEQENKLGDGHHPQEECGGAGPLAATSFG
jgi:hypothetical protein